MKTFYGLVLVAMLAGCSGQESQDPAPQAVVAAPDAAALQKAQYQAQQAEIAKRLEGEEYFIGENNAEKLLALLAQADKESRALVLPADMAAVKEFNTAFAAVAKSAEESFGGPFLADKAGLYQCAAAAHSAYDYFVARQKKDVLTENYRKLYTDSVAVCQEQIQTPPAAEATVYARKGIKLPLDNCLSVLAGDEEFDTYTCPMTVK